MSRRRTLGTQKKIALLVGAAAVAGGGAFFAANASNAAQTTQEARTKAAQDSGVCQGLATALGNNQRFIEGQRANPDAQSQARIENREAVVAEIERKQAASGCAVGESAQDPQAEDPQAQDPQAQDPQAQESQAAQPPQQDAGDRAGGAAQAGEQVCAGSTVTLSGEGGAPAASSDRFPVGTKLRVTNLDNGMSTTVEVNSVSGSCALLNNAAFEQVREEGKFLIRRALIEKVG